MIRCRAERQGQRCMLPEAHAGLHEVKLLVEKIVTWADHGKGAGQT